MFEKMFTQMKVLNQFFSYWEYVKIKIMLKLHAPFKSYSKNKDLRVFLK